ncbi:type II toxin-antitoxin system RelE/ParE family toxin [Cohnella soli]|uniref:Type II toxin-antitoxin system RelE/ParE family toxin n=1 Tax=Cohnella soli TaxID=425005 RepID=A0ABW0HQ57_9BACL
MANVQYSHAALDDLQQLSEYLTNNWGELIAKRVLQKITSDIRRLEQYPALGTDLGKNINVPSDYRYIFSEKNDVFYRIEAEAIKIIRVLHEQQDYMQQLFGLSKED